MEHTKPAEDEALEALARQLTGTRQALLSVASAMERDPERDGSASIVRSQLEWAASHLFAAIKELSGEVLPSSPMRKAASKTKPVSRTTSPMEGLKGHTQAIAIPEILGFVSSLRKSGVLTISSRDESFLVQLEEGSVVYAQGDAPPPGLLLGEILIHQGATTREELSRFLGRDSINTPKLGRVLLHEGLITREQLCIALAFQVQHVFHRMYVAQDAVFQFDEGVQTMEGDDIRLNVTSLLLESARSTDEAEAAPGERDLIDPGL